MVKIHLERAIYWLAFHSLNLAARFGGGDKTHGVRVMLSYQLFELSETIVITRRVRDYRAGRVTFISLEELMAEYGLEDPSRN